MQHEERHKMQHDHTITWGGGEGGEWGEGGSRP